MIETPGPKRSTRIGVIVTIFFNIFICEFIYFNAIAVPEFRQKEWDISLQSFSGTTAPAFALIQNTQFLNRAILDNEEQTLEALCKEKISPKNPLINQRCFSDHLQNYKYSADSTLRYLLFNGSSYKQMDLTGDNNNLDLWYSYKCEYPDPSVRRQTAHLHRQWNNHRRTNPHNRGVRQQLSAQLHPSL